MLLTSLGLLFTPICAWPDVHSGASWYSPVKPSRTLSRTVCMDSVAVIMQWLRSETGSQGKCRVYLKANLPAFNELHDTKLPQEIPYTEEKSNSSQTCAWYHDILENLGAICKNFVIYDVVSIDVSSAPWYILGSFYSWNHSIKCYNLIVI